MVQYITQIPFLLYAPQQLIYCQYTIEKGNELLHRVKGIRAIDLS